MRHRWCWLPISAARQTRPRQFSCPAGWDPLNQRVQSPTWHCLGRWDTSGRALLLGAKDNESPGSPFPWPLSLGPGDVPQAGHLVARGTGFPRNRWL